MSPEQADDPRSANEPSDIYGFGATFYHLLTGATPFDAPSVFQILLKHKIEPLIPPKTRQAQLSGWLSDCLERCLAKSPRDRFASFAELNAVLIDAATSSPWHVTNDAQLQAHWNKYEQRRPAYLARAPLAEFDRYDFPHGRRLLIGHGDLTRQQCDALVSSDDDSLSMTGGVALALAQAAGEEYVQEAARYRFVRPGKAVVTSAGRLAAKYVFHCVTLGYQTVRVSEWVSPSRDMILDLVESCFYHADSLGVESIALPLIGTGTAGFDRQICLDTLFAAIARKLLHEVGTIREARIVLR